MKPKKIPRCMLLLDSRAASPVYLFLGPRLLWAVSVIELAIAETAAIVPLLLSDAKKADISPIPPGIAGVKAEAPALAETKPPAAAADAFCVSSPDSSSLADPILSASLFLSSCASAATI